MKLKKSKKIALILSLSLGLTLPVWAAEPVKITTIVDRLSETGADLSAYAEGLTSQGTEPDGTSFTITVQALAGANASKSADAEAFGIVNTGIINTGDNTITVTATGGKAFSSLESVRARASAYGILNNATLTTGANTIVVTATGGEAEYARTGGSGYADAFARAYGIANSYALTTGANTITVTAIGGKSVNTGATYSEVEVLAYGIQNSGPLTTANNTIKVMAVGGEISSANSESRAYAEAYGIANSNILTTEANTITVTVTGGVAESSSAYARAYAEAYGIQNNYGYGMTTLTTEANTITMTATGGTAKSSSGSADAATIAFGIRNEGTLTTEKNTITVAATGGVAESNTGSADASAIAHGIGNADTLNIKANTITVTATGGAAAGSFANSNARAYGIANVGTLTTEANTIAVTATGGAAESNSDDADASVVASGIQNNYGYGMTTLTTGTNTITVTATGGTAESNSGSVYGFAVAYGITNSDTLTTEANIITVTATGGTAESSSGSAIASTGAYGITNDGALNTGANTIRAIAAGGIAEGTVGAAEAVAIGMYSNNGGNLTAVGSQNIYTEAVGGTVNGVAEKAYAYALLAAYDGTITLDSQGEAVQLTGDVGVNGSGAITISLDNSDSYWRPLFQDTYGSAVNGYFGNGSFAIQDGGVLDLAWHANQGGYSFKDSQLDLTGPMIQIGDGATFIVNADLANDAADTISANTTATGTHYVQVAYDPSYLTYESVAGRALVLDFAEANGQGMASMIETPARNVTLMPTMDGGYLVNLTFTSEVGEAGKTASDSYQQQANILRAQWSTLIQRLGDVRNENPDSHNGSWARIHGGKLKSDGAYGRKSTLKYGGVQAGYDRMRETGSGKYLAGFLVDYMDADSDFRRGEGNTESLAFGGYWTWLSPKGHYTDVVVKATHLDTEYDFAYLSGEKASADFKNWGYTLSMEYGYRYDLKKNHYIEPQAQFLVGRLESKNYRTSNGVNFHQDGVNLAMGRLGVLLGWTDENKSSAYLRGSLVHDFSGSGSLTSSYEGDRMKINTADNAGTSFEVNVGANMIVGKNSHLYAELTKSFGGDVKTDWQANLGWRVKW